MFIQKQKQYLNDINRFGFSGNNPVAYQQIKKNLEQIESMTQVPAEDPDKLFYLAHYYDLAEELNGYNLDQFNKFDVKTVNVMQISSTNIDTLAANLNEINLMFEESKLSILFVFGYSSSDLEKYLPMVNTLYEKYPSISLLKYFKEYLGYDDQGKIKQIIDQQIIKLLMINKPNPVAKDLSYVQTVIDRHYVPAEDSMLLSDLISKYGLQDHAIIKMNKIMNRSVEFRANILMQPPDVNSKQGVTKEVINTFNTINLLPANVFNFTIEYAEPKPKQQLAIIDTQDGIHYRNLVLNMFKPIMPNHKIILEPNIKTDLYNQILNKQIVQHLRPEGFRPNQTKLSFEYDVAEIVNMIINSQSDEISKFKTKYHDELNRSVKQTAFNNLLSKSSYYILESFMSYVSSKYNLAEEFYLSYILELHKFKKTFHRLLIELADTSFKTEIEYIISNNFVEINKLLNQMYTSLLASFIQSKSGTLTVIEQKKQIVDHFLN
jgi:hypothetical protein